MGNSDIGIGSPGVRCSGAKCPDAKCPNARCPCAKCSGECWVPGAAKGVLVIPFGNFMDFSKLCLIPKSFGVPTGCGGVLGVVQGVPMVPFGNL